MQPTERRAEPQTFHISRRATDEWWREFSGTKGTQFIQNTTRHTQWTSSIICFRSTKKLFVNVLCVQYIHFQGSPLTYCEFELRLTPERKFIKVWVNVCYGWLHLDKGSLPSSYLLSGLWLCGCCVCVCVWTCVGGLSVETHS